jgi:hypothetical protein
MRYLLLIAVAVGARQVRSMPKMSAAGPQRRRRSLRRRRTSFMKDCTVNATKVCRVTAAEKNSPATPRQNSPSGACATRWWA